MDLFKNKPVPHRFAREQRELLELTNTELYQAAKYDFKTFITLMKPDYEFEWFHQVIIDHIQELLFGHSFDKLMLLLPPRSGKSELGSQLLPAWLLGLMSERVLRGGATPYEIILASYNDSLASEFISKQLSYVESPEYSRIFPLTRVCPRGQVYGTRFKRSNDSFDMVSDVGTFEFRHKGGDYKKSSSMRSLGIGGSITGKGGDIILMDDLVKDIKQAMNKNTMDLIWRWYQSTLSTRLENRFGRRGKVLLMNTRWVENDVAGKLLEMEGDEWKILRFPAFPYQKNSKYQSPLDTRRSGEVLSKRMGEAFKRAKKVLSSTDFSALYQQIPVAEAGNLIKGEDIQFYTEPPKSFDVKILVGDLAYREGEENDYSVYNIWGVKAKEQQYYLLDQRRGKWNYTAQREILQNLSTEHGGLYGVYLEDASNASALYDDLNKSVVNFQLWKPKTDKKIRVLTIQHLFEQHRVFLPDPEVNPEIEDNVHEFTRFPSAKHDDCVDAMSMALIILKDLVQSFATTILLGDQSNWSNINKPKRKND